MINTKLHIDLQWLNKLSTGFERYHKVRDGVFSCRCVICGDSKTDKKKTRLFFLIKKNNLNAYCHKCGYSHSFFKFMSDVYPQYFEEYKRETLLDGFKGHQTQSKAFKTTADTKAHEKLNTVTQPAALTLNQLKQLSTNIIDLPSNHPAKKMLVDRAFSNTQMRRLFYTDDFKSLASVLNSESTKKLKEGEPRIIIPFVNASGKVDMIQGRSLDADSRMRYISIKEHDDVTKIFGLNELDESRTSYCVEGPIDSLFVENCIATCDANLTRAEADVYIWDNQPRQRDIIRYMESAIETNKSLVIWPVAPNRKLDINDMIKGGISISQLMTLIRSRTYKGLTAKVKFMEWKKL